MFFYLSKALYFLLMPAGLITLALLAVVLSKKPNQRKMAFGLVLACWWLFGNGFLSDELARRWELPPAVPETSARQRVGLVLTGGLVKADERFGDRIFLGDQGDRLAQALLLYKAGHIQKVLISGGEFTLPWSAAVRQKKEGEGLVSARFLMAAGVPARDILLERRSRNTYENALYSASVLRKRFAGYEVVLLTSAFHQRRAVACFRRQGVAVTPYPASFLAGERKVSPEGLLLPSERALFVSYTIIRELVGYGTYALLGYL